MATPQRRWPKNAEAARNDTRELAQEIVRLAEQARNKIKSNPMLADTMLADIRFFAERIRRLMVEAKNGQDDDKL